MATSELLVLITGANQGLGFELAKNLLLGSSTYHILIGSRNLSKGEAAVKSLESMPIRDKVDTIQIDVTDDTSVDAAAKHVEITYGKLDVLVNNAGILSLRPVNREAIRKTLAVNLVGPVSVTEAFLPLLRKSSSPRLIFVSSSLGSITFTADPSSPYFAPTRGTEYRSSKAALSVIMVQYHNSLTKEGFIVHGTDPGLNATNLTQDPDSLRARGAPEPSVGAEQMAAVVRGERDADAGRICGVYGVLPW